MNKSLLSLSNFETGNGVYDPSVTFFLQFMSSRLLLLATAFLGTSAIFTSSPCKTDADCSLNGVCTSGACVCDPGWTTLMTTGGSEPGCGYLDLAPSPVSICGPGCVFHGGKGGVDKTTTSWGGSVIREPAATANGDSKFFMFAAEMAQHCTLSKWTTNSQVVMATSTDPLGPFVRQNVAIPPWSHNPEAVLAPDGTWVIYTLGPGFGKKPQTNCTPGASTTTAVTVTADEIAADKEEDGAITANFTLHYAKSPEGPWSAKTMIVEDWNASWTMQNPGNWNPAPVVLADGRVQVMAHTDWGPWSGEVILEAKTWEGPYKILSGQNYDLLDHCDYCEEDPFMWIDTRGHYHVLYHRMFDAYGLLDSNWGKYNASSKPPGGPVPHGWAGGHAFSADGLKWSTWNRCYNTSLPLTNGTTVEVNRRERPKLLFDPKGKPTHLYNGAITDWGTYTIVAPINHQK